MGCLHPIRCRRVASPSALYMVGPIETRSMSRRREPRPAGPTNRSREPSLIPVPSPELQRRPRHVPASGAADDRTDPSRSGRSLRSRRGEAVEPVAGPSHVGTSSQASAASSHQSHGPTTVHQCPDCPMSFPTVIGLGQHRRHRHKEAYNEAINVERVRRGWSEEELLLLASEEAAATRRGIRFINLHLESIVPNRTLDSIKGARKGDHYRSLVANMLQEEPESSSSGEDFLSAEEDSSPSPHPTHSDASPRTPSEQPPFAFRCPSPRDGIDRLIATVQNIRGWNSLELVRLAREFLAGGDVMDGVSQWLEDTIPSGPTLDITARPFRPRIVNPTSKMVRRREYSRMQRMFRKNMSRAAKEILDGAGHEGDVPDVAILAAFWGPLVSRQSPPVPRVAHTPPRDDLVSIWAAISIEEVVGSPIPLNAAPGLDGLSPRLWRSVPASLKALLFNVLLGIGRLPSSLLSSRTVFIPKKVEQPTPADFRPISITSVIIRQLHRILAQRIRDAGLVNLKQRCFDDGCAENVAVLATILQDARSRLREVHIASLDVAKAFDSVSHSAVDAVLERLGLPAEFRSYVSYLYQHSTTTFEVRGQRTEYFSLGRGVRQGDPLSPVLFCLVIDRVLETIPRGVGYEVGGERINCIAFADDVLLFASTKWGLQTALDHVEEEAAVCGLALNERKCSVLSIVPSGKEKKSKVVTVPTFRLRRGDHLPQLSSTASWRYLGVDFEPVGTRCARYDLRTHLDSISKAPLKPQQRLKILRCFLLPRLYHGLVLGKVTLGLLRAFDLDTRSAVRRWLRLPHDVAVGYFHAPVREGGLGIPSMATTVPGLIYDRYQHLGQSTSPAVKACADLTWVQQRLRWASAVLSRGGEDLFTHHRRGRWWAMRLHASTDGWELRESAGTNLSTHWIDAGCLAVPGKDFVQYTHVHVNCLPSQVRTSRGVRRTQRDVRCRAGCGVNETAAHIVQSCHRTHGGRVKRHNAVANTLAAGLRDKGWTVIQEPLLDTGEGRRKPDIVAKKGQDVCVIDPQIVSGAKPLDVAHDRKVEYYADNIDLPAAVMRHLGIKAEDRKPTFLSCTLSWRGVWSRRSALGLLHLGLTKSLLHGITTRVLQGSHTNWTRWNRMTTMAPRTPCERTGIG